MQPVQRMFLGLLCCLCIDGGMSMKVGCWLCTIRFPESRL